MTLHNLGEMGFLGVKTDLFGHPLPFHPQFTHEKPSKSIAYTTVGEMGEMGEFTPATVGEMGESPIGLTNSPTPTHAREADTELVVKQPTFDIVSPMEQSPVVSTVEQSDPYELHLAKRTRHWFGQGVTLTFREADGVAQGRDRYGYLWAEVAR